MSYADARVYFSLAMSSVSFSINHLIAPVLSHSAVGLPNLASFCSVSHLRDVKLLATWLSSWLTCPWMRLSVVADTVLLSVTFICGSPASSSVMERLCMVMFSSIPMSASETWSFLPSYRLL